ncbi:MAG: nucleoside monophosphate kinase [Candidatus Solibacter sp.]
MARLTPRSVLACLAVLASAAYGAGPVVLVVGPPGSGRSTQAAILNKDLGMAVVAADALIASHAEKFQKNRTPTLQGVDPHLDPAMNDIVEEALRATDLSKGVVLDGYPASKIQGDFLTGLLDMKQVVVIHLSVADDVVRKRLKKQDGRDIEQELKDYHREFDFIRTYFPEADIQTVDGTKSPAQVAKRIRKVLDSRPK